jgi:BolA protein
MSGEVQKTINERLSAQALQHLEVLNESDQHNVPPNSETHFKVIMVSSLFDGLSKVKRHQWMYGQLSDLMQNPIHALSLNLYTANEWENLEAVPASPACSKKK